MTRAETEVRLDDCDGEGFEADLMEMICDALNGGADMREVQLQLLQTSIALVVLEQSKGKMH